MTTLASKNYMPKQLQKDSRSPKGSWEEWMEWNPSTNQSSNPQLASPRETNSEKSHLENGSNSQGHSPIQNLEPLDAPIRKRKASEAIGETNPGRKGQIAESNAIQIRSHSLAEKRYRTNLNEKIAELRQCVPSLRDPPSTPSKAQGLAATANYNKATILTKAIEYIHLLEKRNAYLEDANSTLQKFTVRTAKKVRDDKVDIGKSTPKLSSDEYDGSHNSSQASTTATDEPIGMIPVPEDMRRLRDAVHPQAHYADQYLPRTSSENTPSGSVSIVGGRSIGKLMVGSLAGLMIMDSFARNGKEANDDRGLFALPLKLILRFLRTLKMTFPAFLIKVPCGRILVPLAKGLLLFAILSMVMFLYLFNSKPNLGKLIVAPGDKTLLPSASPMDMRRNAWLTAIQTVWVPRHTMLPELIALVLETHAYLTRNLLGWHSYSWLTNRTEEDEIARVRAWEIAIDAQLAGGDAELSRSRLVLTLWASGTLPNTPARLMLKALHIRILFWQASRYQWISEVLNTAGKQLAYKQWQLGVELIENPTVSKDPNGSDPLSDHLVALLQQPIAEVMTNGVILRAHNLAWGGFPYGSHGERESTMHTEDTAMFGSLDTLAVRSSELKLHQSLLAFIEANEISESYQSQIELALRIAPPGSISFFRALAAMAVVCEMDRCENITILLGALRPCNNLSLQASPPAEPSPPSAEFESVSVAVDCACAMESIAQSEDKPKALYEALQVLNRVLPKAETLDLLAFAAVYELMRRLSEQNDSVGQPTLNFKRTLSSAITRLSRPTAHASMQRLELKELYKRAIEIIEFHNTMARRVSNASVDSGYGSMVDYTPNS